MGDLLEELDSKADTDGVDSIAPLYGLMIPMKGTGAVVQYPSGSGCGVLSGYTPVKEAAVTSLIKERHGIIFGTTNVPEFAYGYRTANPASGHFDSHYKCPLCPRDPKLRMSKNSRAMSSPVFLGEMALGMILLEASRSLWKVGLPHFLQVQLERPSMVPWEGVMDALNQATRVRAREGELLERVRADVHVVRWRGVSFVRLCDGGPP